MYPPPQLFVHEYVTLTTVTCSPDQDLPLNVQEIYRLCFRITQLAYGSRYRLFCNPLCIDLVRFFSKLALIGTGNAWLYPTNTTEACHEKLLASIRGIFPGNKVVDIGLHASIFSCREQNSATESYWYSTSLLEF